MAQSSKNLFIFFKRLATRLLPSYALLEKECKTFALYLEKNYFPEASRQDFEAVELEILPGAQAFHVCEGPEMENVPRTPRWIKFLEFVGLKKISLDARLESNQIVDVFMALYGMRSSLKRRDASKVEKSNEGFYSDEGMLMYCSQVRISPDDRRLLIRYSYCELTFSKAVTAFKKRNKTFRDHRSFFYAAPRYAFLITLALVIVPAILHSFLPGYEILILTLVGFIVGILTYFLFQTIGSIEYDKEEQAQEIRKAHRSLQEKQWLIDQDLEKASQIQKQILPGEYFQLRNFEVAAFLRPQSQIGGDFYDIWETSEGHLSVMMVDCVGHGLFSALIATAIKSVFLSSQGRPVKPSDLISSIELVLERILPMGFFAALTYVDIDPIQSKVTLLNAGNPFPILIHSDGSHDLIKQANSVPLGIPVQSQRYEPWEFFLKKGEKVILYTDGISESKDMQGKYYTEDRLRKLISKNHHLNATELRDLVSQDTRTFLSEKPQSDDQTFLVIHAS